MKISVFIDNNVWDELFSRQIDIRTALPESEFELFITREAEFEIESMPEEKKRYSLESIDSAGIKTDRIFGFYDDRYSRDEQRVGGFGDKFNSSKNAGRFVDKDEARATSKEIHLLGSKNPKTGLLKHEADIALAARAVHSVVLTFDNRRSLKRAANGGRVISLAEWDSSVCLSDYIKQNASL
nr:hypothetical protein [Halomonas sp. UBA3074]